MVLLDACVWKSTDPDLGNLPLDDSAYPYAGLPRIVIETANFQQLRNTSTYIPAYLQIYGKDSATTDVIPLSVRGRGTSSFHGMPKYSIKLKFEQRHELLKMPSNKEWALISNYADKTHLRNNISLKLYTWLGGKFAPKTQFVELYLNRDYQGLYLLSETIKVGKNRINIPKNDDSFLFEKTSKKGIKDTDVIIETNNKNLFCIKSPQNATKDIQNVLLIHLNDWESLLENNPNISEDSLKKWIDIEDYLRYYWVQEFAKNTDANFNRSIFITWEEHQPMHYGPIWDFDIAYGNTSNENIKKTEGWYVRSSSWDQKIFMNKTIAKKACEFWNEHKNYFSAVPDSVRKYAEQLLSASKNDRRRWPTANHLNYNEAIDSLNNWIVKRFQWIEKQIL